MIRRLLPASGIRKIFDIANKIQRGGKEVLHLEIGRPDWKLPPGAEDGAIEALRGGFNHYLPNRGLLELRESVARHIKKRSGKDYDPETEIIITLGGSEAICMAMLALLGEGDEVIIPQPTWPHYGAIIQMAGGNPVYIETKPEQGFAYKREDFERALTKQTRIIVLNSPNNPTGAVQNEENLRGIVELAERHHLLILSDEVYQDFVYEGRHISLAELVEDKSSLILVNSFSKSFSMTGWRIGWVATDAKISDAMNRIHQYLTVCGVAFAQKGVSQLLDNEKLPAYLKEMNNAFRKRYEVWRDAFRGIDGATLVPPGGAFYIFPEFKLKQMTAREFCEQCLNDIQVAMVPGDVFGERYKNCVRISYGRDLKTQKKAANKLIEYLKYRGIA